MILFVVDLRAAFDSVDRIRLVMAMRERGVREGLVSRCEDILRETSFRVKVEEEGREGILIGKGGDARLFSEPFAFQLAGSGFRSGDAKGKMGGS